MARTAIFQRKALDDDPKKPKRTSGEPAPVRPDVTDVAKLGVAFAPRTERTIEAQPAVKDRAMHGPLAAVMGIGEGIHNAIAKRLPSYSAGAAVRDIADFSGASDLARGVRDQDLGALAAGALMLGTAGEGKALTKEARALSIAKRNLKKGSMTAHSLRELSHEEALNVASQLHHLKQDAKTGQYIGAPRGVDSPAKLTAVRRNFDNQVTQGVEGGDWYPRAQEGIREVTRDPAQADLFSNELAGWSAQADPDVNLGFALTGHNTYEAGLPQPIVRSGPQMQRYVAARDKGGLQKLGPKTGIYESHINPNKAGAVTGTNDIWHARAFGFLDKDGKPLSRGLTAQEHAFLDAETVLAAARANAKGLGGRTDWNIGAVQAAPWVYGKAQGLVAKSAGQKMTMAEGLAKASQTYKEHLNKYGAFATHEPVPGAGTGHMEGVLELPFSERQSYGAAAPWTNPAGKDVLYDATGMYQRTANPATGYFNGPRGVEVNPGEVARPLVELQKDEHGARVGDVSRKVLSGVEGFRALMDAQNAGAWHKMIPVSDAGAKARVGTSAFVPMERQLTEAEMKGLAPIAQKYGMGLSDTGQGLSVMSFPWEGGPSTPKDIKAILEAKHELGGALRPLGGKAERARLDSDYINYGPLIGAEHAATSGVELMPAGNAKSTNKMLSLVDQVPTLAGKLDAPDVRSAVGAKYARDESMAAKLGMSARPDIQNARRIFSAEGIAGLRAAVARGELLPAAVAAIGLGSALYPTAAAQRKQPGA